MALVRSDFKKWPILCLLEEEFISKIYMVLVFGASGNSAIILTVDKMVYIMSNDSAMYLETNDSPIRTLVPQKIQALCGKDIKTFAYGHDYLILALTEQGEVYSWGYYTEIKKRDTYSGKDVVHKNKCSLPTKIETNGERIVDIACSATDSLALTRNGEVYQLKCGELYDEFPPLEMTEEKKITSSLHHLYITCGSDFNMLVTNIGNVYAWGNNSVGQLGSSISENKKIEYPTKIAGLLNIVKIACGFSHTLALNDKGELYVWGGNSHGQLGIGNLSDRDYPTKLDESHMGKILDVAAIHYNHLSAAINENGCVFVWGQCFGQAVVEPKATSFTQLHEVFSTLALSKVMYKPLLLYPDEQSQIFSCLKNAFDNPSTSDLTIKVENKAIHVHKVVLKMRSEYFRTMLQKQWDNDESVLKLESFSYDVFKAFLQYLYTGDVDLPTDDMLDLMILAKMYLEDRLTSHCVKKLKNNMTVSNVISMYIIAKYNNLEDLMELCFKFVINHMTAVVDTEDFASLDKESTVKLIKEAAKVGLFKS